MGMFVSYSSRDRQALENMLSALRRAHEQVWFDEELGGGEMWWRMILDRIRDCDVFIFALSANSLRSKPCLAELSYAQDLGKPILPIMIGPVESMRLTPLATVEVIDYQDPTVDSGIRLITAVRDARERTTPLPSPLPEEPPVPFAYLMRLSTTIAGPELSPSNQTLLLSELKAGLDEDGHDATARGDISRLLKALRDRADVTYRTRTEVESLLASIGQPATVPAGPAERPDAGQAPTPHPAPRRRPARTWLIAGASVAVVAAILGVVLTRDRHPTAQQPQAAPTVQSEQPAQPATAADAAVKVVVDGRQLTTTGRPMCISVSNRSTILIAAPDAASQVMVTLLDDQVEGIVIPIDNNPFVVGMGNGRATATKTGESSWTFTGEVSGVQTASTSDEIKPFLIEVTCP